MRTFALIVALALVAGLPNLPRPMHGDQVLFMQGGESLARGELLYRDFWDVKQPGVFVFYWAGGKLFGFDEIGIHIIDLLYWFAFAILIAMTWPRMIGEPRTSAWPAITTAGWYWSVTGSVQQTQVEALVGPLLYLHLWLLVHSSPPSPLRRGGPGTRGQAAASADPSPQPRPRSGEGEKISWAIGGVVAAAVVLFKFMFMPLLVVAWLFAANRLRREHGWRVVAKFTLCYGVAGIIALAASAIPWLVAGEIHALIWTFFEVPAQMLDEIPPASPRRLLEAAQWFGTRYGPMAPLALIGAIRFWRTGRREWVVVLAAWMGVGLAIIVAQRLSWWSYHLMLLATPLGLLAAEGCAALASGGRHVRLGLLFLLLSPATVAIALKWIAVASHGFCLTAADRQAILLEDSVYAGAKEETAFLRESSSKPGAIYVAGEPVYNRFANRKPAVPIHGWSLELYPADVRINLAKQLIDAEPAYIFIDRVYYANLIEERYPEVAALLRMDYRVFRESGAGTWYERKR